MPHTRRGSWWRGRRTRITCAVASLAFAVIGVPAAGATTVATEAQLRAAFGDPDETRIDLAAGIELRCQPPAGGAVARDSATPLTLDGHGFAVEQTCIAADAENNVLVQDGTGSLTLEDVTITGGYAEADGGGVLAIGPVTVVRSSIVGNAAVTGPNAAGGGIASDGEVTVIDSSISANRAILSGGIAAAGTVTALRSTISANEGGGIGAAPGAVAVNVIDSTVADNFAPAPASGISTDGLTTLVYATVVRNRSQDFPNIDSEAGLTSFASVVALPLGSERNCLVGPKTSHGYNFSDDPEGTCGFTGPTDRGSGGDPGLGALAANGGPTSTMLPLVGSPLLDAIPAADCRADGAADVTTDQRGITRPQGGSCDIGAVEVAPPPPSPPPGPPTPPSNEFEFGKLERNLHRGTAKLRVRVPGAGTLRLARSRKLKPQDKSAASAGKTWLKIKPRGMARKRLRAHGKVKARAKVTYTPTGGDPLTKSKRVKLKRSAGEIGGRRGTS